MKQTLNPYVLSHLQHNILLIEQSKWDLDCFFGHNMGFSTPTPKILKTPKGTAKIVFD